MKRLATVTACVLLASCATAATKQSVVLQQAIPCCRSIAEFTYRALPAPKAKFKLDENSPVFDFEKGRSYFAAFEIPANSTRHFRMKSYFNGMLIGQYYDPVILVLDERHHPITIGALQLEFVDGNMFKDNNAHMVGEFRVDANAKYLVVMTSKFEDMAPVARTRPMGYGYMVGSVPVAGMTGGTSIQLERSPTGTLLIEPVQSP